MFTNNKDINTMNEGADFWYYEIGANVIPSNTQRKETYTNWSQWQDNPIPEELYKQKKEIGEYANGIAVVTGKIWRGKYSGKYLVAIDCDNKKAIEEVCSKDGSRTISIAELANWTIVEQHQNNPDKAHIYIISTKPFKNKSSDKINTQIFESLDKDEIPAIEVKCEKHIMFCFPSFHKDGSRYQIIGKKEPVLCDEFEDHIDNICNKFGISYLQSNSDNDHASVSDKIPIGDLFETDTKILEGHNRHEALLRIMESLLIRLKGIYPIDNIKKMALDWNQTHCIPPLEIEQFEKQWKCATKYLKSDKPDSRSSDNGHDKRKETKSNAQVLDDLAKKNIFLFKDQFGNAHSIITVNDDHKEVLSIESSRFERYLSKLYYDNNKKNNTNKKYLSYPYSNGIINKETITNVIRKLQADAEFEGQTIPLHLRVAWGNKKDGDIHNDTKYYTGDRDSIYYDLTDEKWRCVKITKNQGWKILDSFSEERKNDNVLFTRYTQTPQFEPKRNYDHEIFNNFIQNANIKNKNHIILLKVVIISLFVPKIPHPILLIHGDKGSAKSTLQKKIKLLVDPGLPELLSINFNKEEFIQQLDHNYLAFYDNVRFEPKWLSDEACKAVTEIGFTRRKLYTNNEDQIFKYIRCLSFSGINVIFTEPDALERSIMIELEEIKDEYKIPGDQIYSDFVSQIPHLLGYIFDTLSKAMHLKDSIKLEKIPRMADFAVWGEAIAQSMGYKQLEFLDAYYENLGEQNKEIIESDSFAESLAKMIDYEKACWVGSPKMLIQDINEYCEANIIDTNKFPKQPNTLVKKLKKIRSIIRSGIGIEIIIERITSGKGNKGKFNSTLIKIRKISPESPISPINNNNEMVKEYLSGDRPNDFDNISSQYGLSPVIFDEKCGQKTEKEDRTGDTGNTGDVLSNFSEQPDLYDFKGIDDNLKNKIIDHLKKKKYLKCHNKNCNKEYLSLGEYNSHCFNKHPKQPLYPTLELMKQLSLEQRNNPWE